MRTSGSEQTESMSSLRTKLAELKAFRKTLQDQVSRHDTEMRYLDADISRSTTELERKEKSFLEKQEKLRKYNEVLEASEAALARLTETATKLDGILGDELSSIKTAQSSQ